MAVETTKSYIKNRRSKKSHMHDQVQVRAFTLIELLIVVAIIAILAAIAVPNFLEAQTRSKVSRTKADMRTCGLAIKTYLVDHNWVPARSSTGTGEYLRWTDLQGLEYGIGYQLTTPVAYLTSIPFDVFNTQAFKRQRPHNFPHMVAQASFFYRGAGRANQQAFWFGWSSEFDKLFTGKLYKADLQTAGPDLDPWTPAQTPFYDPTNGTISPGDIWWFDTEGFLPRD